MRAKQRSLVLGSFEKWPFLIGLFGLTQFRVIGSIGISEAVMLIVAPYVFIKNISLFRRDNVFLIFVLSFLWICGAVFADMHNNSFFGQWVRGIAAPIVTLCNLICIYVALRKRLSCFKWLLTGLAISSIVSIFVFQKGTSDLSEFNSGISATEAIIGYKLFLANTLTTVLTLPAKVNYLDIPMFYTVSICALIMGVHVVNASRSSLMAITASLVLMIIAGRRYSGIKKMHGVKIIILFVVLGIAAISVKSTYKYTVAHGIVDEQEAKKYELQTRQGEGFLSMLIAGRSEFFIDMMAVSESPIVGYGSHALDRNGMVPDFLGKYGSESECQNYWRLYNLQGGIMIMPFHSIIGCFWVWHGIFGGLFWLYALYLIGITLVKRLYVIPRLYGYFAFAIPISIWDIFFSPYGSRIELPMLLCLCLIVKVVEREKRLIGFSQWEES